jgi:hypothetical protein
MKRLMLFYAFPLCSFYLLRLLRSSVTFAEEKITIGQPDDVTASEGQFSLVKLPYQIQRAFHPATSLRWKCIKQQHTPTT